MTYSITSNQSPPFIAHPVTAFGFKLPPFWANGPTICFTQIDAQFIIQGITAQETTIAYVMASFQPDIAQEVRDIVIEPPTERSYDSLKVELIRHKSASLQKHLHKLLYSKELGERMPSQLLWRI